VAFAGRARASVAALRVRLSDGSGHSSRSLWYTAAALQMPVSTVEIPNRSLFRQPEVCEIAQVQPYMLRSWEAEFPDLGVTKTAGGPRVYRRADLERVLRLKHLLFVEGLTLAGARRKLEAEQAPVVDEGSGDLDALIGSDVRQRIMELKRSLRELQAMLSGSPEQGERPEAFTLQEPPRRVAKKPAPRKPAKGTKKRAS
jgi:DNA-binding transcriptional MerR regulator